MKFFGDQFLEHAVEALLGDAEDVEQSGDGQAGMPADEMQHAVMSAAEAVGLQHAVRVADEIAIGEIEQLDQVVHRARLPRSRARADSALKFRMRGAPILGQQC